MINRRLINNSENTSISYFSIVAVGGIEINGKMNGIIIYGTDNFNTVINGFTRWNDITQLSNGAFIIVGTGGRVAYGTDLENLTINIPFSHMPHIHGVTQLKDGTIVIVGQDFIAYGKDHLNFSILENSLGYWLKITQLKDGTIFAVGKSGIIAHGQSITNITFATNKTHNWHNVCQALNDKIVCPGSGGHYLIGIIDDQLYANRIDFLDWNSAMILSNGKLTLTGAAGRICVYEGIPRIYQHGNSAINDIIQLPDSTIFAVSGAGQIFYGLDITNLAAINTSASILTKLCETNYKYNIEPGIVNGSFEDWTDQYPKKWVIELPHAGFGIEKAIGRVPPIIPTDGNEALGFYRWGPVGNLPNLHGNHYIEQSGITVNTIIWSKLVIDVCALYFAVPGGSQEIRVYIGLWQNDVGSIVPEKLFKFKYAPDAEYATEMVIDIPEWARNTIITNVTFHMRLAIRIDSNIYTCQRFSIDNIRFE